MWTITDLDSTNGTYLGDTFEQLEANTATPIDAGTAIYVGAWTRIELTPLT